MKWRKCDQLLEKGWTAVPPLSKDKCDSIVEQIKDFTFKAWSDPHEVRGLDFGGAQHNIYKVMDHKLTMKIPEVKELMKDEGILALVAGYLEGEPIQTQANCWFSVPHNAVEPQQKFHQDYTFKKLIKLFLYLTDVTLKTGPLAYVPGSLKNMIHPKKNYGYSKRVEDKFINEHYSEIKYFTGEKGTMNLVDTRGWHRGTALEEGHRIIIQFEWTDDTTRISDGKKLKYV